MKQLNMAGDIMVSTHGSDTPPIFQRSRQTYSNCTAGLDHKKVSRAIQLLWRVSVGLFTWARRWFCRTSARCQDSCTKTGVRLSLLSICGCVCVSKAVNENCVGYWMRERKSARLQRPVIISSKGEGRRTGGERKNARERGSEAETRPERLRVKRCAPWRSSAATSLCWWLGSIVPV